MSEAQSEFAVLDDVDKQTFIRFCRYAYTGDYVAADPDILLDSSMIGGLDLAEESVKPDSPDNVLVEVDDAVREVVNSWGSSSKKKKKWRE